jgi:hypothetical protein
MTSVVKVATRQIVERDLRDFQRSLPETLKRVSSIDPKILTPGVDAGVVLHWLPPVSCLAHIFQRSIEALAEPEKLFEDGIAKFFIGKGVLSVDRSTSSVIAESAVVKRSGKGLASYAKILENNGELALEDRLPSEVNIPVTFLSPGIGGKGTRFSLNVEKPPAVGPKVTIYYNPVINKEGKIVPFEATSGKVIRNPETILALLRSKSSTRTPPGSVPGMTNKIVVPEIAVRSG